MPVPCALAGLALVAGFAQLLPISPGGVVYAGVLDDAGARDDPDLAHVARTGDRYPSARFRATMNRGAGNPALRPSRRSRRAAGADSSRNPAPGLRVPFLD